MRHAVLTTVRIGLLFGILSLSPARVAISGEANPLARARELIGVRNDREAAEVLEDSLSDPSGTDRSEILSLLRQTYAKLAKQAQEKGSDREAALYRDNLAILNRDNVPSVPASTPNPPAKPKPSPLEIAETPAPAGPSVPKAKAAPRPDVVLPELEGPSSDSLPVPRKLPAPETLPPPRPLSDAETNPSIGDTASPRPDARNEEASPPVAVPRPEPNRLLKQADMAFHDKHYGEAGQLYAKLAAENSLPSNRNEVWAYCRWTDVVKRINAKPRAAKEWDAIEAEIKSIRQLNPNNWYGEYLLSRVAEARKSRRSLFPSRNRNEKLVVRGSEPEEAEINLPRQEGPKPLPKAMPKARGRAPQLDVDVNASRLDPEPPQRGQRFEPVEPPSNGTDPSRAQAAGPSARTTRPDDRWQVRETPNFRVFHNSPELAERAAQVAESVRSSQGRHWASPSGDRAWTPRCDIYLYPDAKVFSKMTGQPETSPGFTMMGANGGRIISRRVNLRANHPQLLTAILPHEVTHVVLADLFPDRPIPRWADEGMAVLAEPAAEQSSRAAELGAPLQEDRLFTVADLIALDYPEAKDWATYYSQSVSLTRFLVEQGNPADFIRFLQASQRSGLETALRSVYRINDLAELQNQWLRYAKDQASGPAVER